MPRKYVIVPVDQLSAIDTYTDLIETDPNTLRYSLDGSTVMLKYNTHLPLSISLMSDVSGPYDQPEFESIVSTSAWTLETVEWIDPAVKARG